MLAQQLAEDGRPRPRPVLRDRHRRHAANSGNPAGSGGQGTRSASAISRATL